MTPKLYTLTLTEPERDMLRDFTMCHFHDYADVHKDNLAMQLYNKIDNLDPEEVGAS